VVRAPPGTTPDFFPNENEAVWQLAGTGWIYLVGDADRAGQALLTLLVEDLEDLVVEVAERGPAVGAIDTVPGVVRKAVVRDPDGNTITFGEALSTDDREPAS
jgi:catechol 2,3-dioxygenase-like lactoylglutathione lyase family enzyme